MYRVKQSRLQSSFFPRLCSANPLTLFSELQNENHCSSGSNTKPMNCSYPDKSSWHPLEKSHLCISAPIAPTMTFPFPTWLPPPACCVVPQPGKRNSPGREQPAMWPARHSGRGGEWQSTGKTTRVDQNLSHQTHLPPTPATWMPDSQTRQ